MSEYDLAYQYITKPIADVCYKVIPFRLHPNTYTWTGYIASLFACYYLFYDVPDRTLAWLFLGIALIVYNIMDAIDGLVARAEKIPSYEGEVLDHTIDAVCTLGPLALSYWTCEPDEVTRRMVLAHTVFYFCHIQHRFSGGPLVQGIMGWGVDCSELSCGVACISIFLGVEGLAKQGIEIFSYYGVALLIFSGMLGYLVLAIQTINEKKAWKEALNFDLVHWFWYVITTVITAKAVNEGKNSMGWQYIGITFTMPIFFYRCLYLRLEEKTIKNNNLIFQQRHKPQYQRADIAVWLLTISHTLAVLPYLISNEAITKALAPYTYYFFAIHGSVATIFCNWTLLYTHSFRPKLPATRPVGGDKAAHQH